MLKTSKLKGKSSSLNAIVHKAIVEAEGLLPLINKIMQRTVKSIDSFPFHVFYCLFGIIRKVRYTSLFFTSSVTIVQPESLHCLL